MTYQGVEIGPVENAIPQIYSLAFIQERMILSVW
jgi:hypothetical protein